MATVNINTCPVCSGKNFTDFLVCTDYFVSGEKFQIKKCTSCGFKITDKIPDEDSIGPYYQAEEYISHSNTSEGIVNRIYHFAREFMLGQKRKVVVKNCHKKTGNLLDVGAGTGFFAAHMKQHGWDVSGTEKSEDARNFAEKEMKVKLVPAEGIFEFENNTFDAITLWHVMEHFHNPVQYIHEIKRILDAEGKLFIALPNHNSYDAGHYKQTWAAFDVPRHIWHFAPAHVKQIFENNGFSLTKKYRMPLDSFYISMMSEKYKKSKPAFLKGLFFGAVSWVVSICNKDRCSSVIYVFKKNQSSR
ncbi:MAG: class I SAM-dependent methyltransferase [Prolixibacteraceae bacterium]|nr:class I SAM-dependent methyltransferase [Prolixibacteraceae bacterium]MBN2772606.1 class I SAM-dependent methyltransferase [Prolixibacteraceae bacterium]